MNALCAEIPVNEYYEYFGPDYELDVKASNAEDMNAPSYLERVKRIVMENLRHAGGPPGVQMSGECGRKTNSILHLTNRTRHSLDADRRCLG
jgi:histone deacetylase 1/2